jgi:hypothetical protein
MRKRRNEKAAGSSRSDGSAAREYSADESGLSGRGLRRSAQATQIGLDIADLVIAIGDHVRNAGDGAIQPGTPD